MITEEQIDAVTRYTHAAFPDGTDWVTPGGYPTSLGLCIIDSIWSIGVNYNRHVEPVLAKYRALAEAAGQSPDTQTPEDLVAVIAASGGPEGFAAAVNSRHRTSSKNGILKAEAVQHAAQLFVEHEVVTSADLAAQQHGPVKADWHRIRGQRSGVTWKYLLMLAGCDGIKPDRMILRYIADAGGGSVTNDDAIALLTAAQQTWPAAYRPTLLQFDHAIWRRQSKRATR